MVHASTQLSFVCVCGDLARAPHESAELELQYLNAVHLKSTRMCVLLRTYTSGVAPRGARMFTTRERRHGGFACRHVHTLSRTARGEYGFESFLSIATGIRLEIRKICPRARE